MARPINADAGATRRRILDAAGVLFSNKGEGSTSMRDIARGSAVSLATVHHYFGSKADLFQSCVDEMYRELAALRDELTPALLGAQGDGFAPAIEKAVRAAFRFALAHERAVRLMMRIVVDTGEVEASRRDDFLLPFLDQGAPLIASTVDLPIEQVRLSLMTINHFITRYAVTAPAELVLVAGVRKLGDEVRDQDIDEARGKIEDHLVDVTLQLLNQVPRRETK